MALVAVRKGMDYVFSQHDLGYLDDVIPEKDKKKKEDEKKKKQKKKGSIDSEIDFVSVAAESTFTVCVDTFQKKNKNKTPLSMLSFPPPTVRLPLP